MLAVKIDTRGAGADPDRVFRVFQHGLDCGALFEIWSFTVVIHKKGNLCVIFTLYSKKGNLYVFYFLKRAIYA